MAKEIKLNKFFCFHLKLRLRRPSLFKGSSARRWQIILTLNYLIQSSILFFYSFIYKFALPEAETSFLSLKPFLAFRTNGQEVSGPSSASQMYTETTSALRGSDKEVMENILNTYLTGLFEGDGHIWLPNINSSKKHNPRFCITFHLKDKPLAENLLNSIGYGFIRIKLKEKACVLTVSPLKGLIYVIQLLNGNMRTPKIYQLHALIDWVNTHYNFNINKLPLSASPLNSDYWLAGFLEADGCFLIRHSTLATSKKERISCSCVIEQRLIDPKSNENYFKILDEIANLFETKLLITNRNYYRITATSLNSISLVIKYLEQFNLRGSKYLDSLDWIEAVKLIIADNHYTLEGKNRIDLLKNRMNRNRITMDWEHLNKY